MEKQELFVLALDLQVHAGYADEYLETDHSGVTAMFLIVCGRFAAMNGTRVSALDFTPPRCMGKNWLPPWSQLAR